MTQIKIAQIGCGYWGPNLIRTLSRDKNCNLTIVADLSNHRQKFIRDNYPLIEVTDDFLKVLKNPNIDAVVIATPANTHFDLAKIALEEKKDVFVEKPISQTYQQALKLEELAVKNGKILMVGHTYLYNKSIHYLRENLREIGEIYYFYLQRLNLGIVRNDINVWWNLAPHDISILLYLNNSSMPKFIQAKGLAFLQNDIDDVVFSTLIWENGLTAQLHLSWLDPNKTRKITAVGSKKMIVHDDISSEKITIYDKGVDPVAKRNDFDNPKQDFSYRFGDILKPRIEMEEPLKVEIDHFLNCVIKRISPITGPKHAAAVVSILEAGQKSLDNNGKQVTINKGYALSYEN
jgi:predicted dehydrogenase